MIVVSILLCLSVIVNVVLYRRLAKRVPIDVKRSFEQEYDELRNEVTRTDEELAEAIRGREELKLQYEAELEAEKQRLRAQYAESKRTDAKATAARSRVALVAKVAEHFSPYLDGFSYNPKEARHIGEIIDFLVYEGLETPNAPVTVVFLEVKTKASGRVSNPRERRVRDAIKAGRVRYEVFVPQAAIAAKQQKAIEPPT